MVEALLLYYNKDLIAEAPKSFSDLEKIAKDDKYKRRRQEHWIFSSLD